MRTNAAVTIPLPRFATAAFLPYACFVVALAMLFGGGGGQAWSDAIVQLAALPLLAGAMFKFRPSQFDRGGQWALVLLCAIFSLPLLQLVPMPPALWSALPGREKIVSAYQAAGMTLPWLPISLDPLSTWRCLLSLIPPSAIFLAILSIDRKGRLAIIGIMLVIAVASVPLDLMQLAGGPHSPLRFFAITNMFRGVGFFANSNHNAAFLYCTIPFAVALAMGFAGSRHRRRWPAAALTGVLAVIMIGLATTYSRAGIALSFVAGLSSAALAWRLASERSRRTVLRTAVIGNVLALLIVFQFGFAALSERVESQGLKDMRWPVAGITLQAASTNLPLGTGLGSFVPVYEMFAPRTLLNESYVNHAHDDWLELWLEGGIPALVITFLFLCWYVIASVRVWRNDRDGEKIDWALACAGSIVIFLLLVHSVFDFPLRTFAMMTMLAISCALVLDFAWGRSARDASSGGVEGIGKDGRMQVNPAAAASASLLKSLAP